MEEINYQRCNLNIWYHLPEEVFNKIELVYKEMPGWIGFGNGVKGEEHIPYWFSFDENEKYVNASVEPSGLSLEGKMKDKEWSSWIETFKKVASKILEFKVGEIELGEVTYEIEWLNN